MQLYILLHTISCLPFLNYQNQYIFFIFWPNFRITCPFLTYFCLFCEKWHPHPTFQNGPCHLMWVWSDITNCQYLLSELTVCSIFYICDFSREKGQNGLFETSVFSVSKACHVRVIYIRIIANSRRGKRCADMFMIWRCFLFDTMHQ